MSTSILIVDDGVHTRTAIRGMLTSAGFEVVGEADNGLAAVEDYKRLKPDVVLMDINMPILDGISATKEIIKFDPIARIIMLTSLDELSMVREILSAGAKDYVLKPYDPARLLAGIKKVLDVPAN